MWAQCQDHEKDDRSHSTLQYAFHSGFCYGLLTRPIFFQSPPFVSLLQSIYYLTSMQAQWKKIEIKGNVEESEFNVFTCNFNVANVSLSF